VFTISEPWYNTIISHEFIARKHFTSATNEDLERITEIFIKMLNKGFLNEEWYKLQMKISELPEKVLKFSIIFSNLNKNKSIDFIINEKNKLSREIKLKLKMLFSTKNKRNEIKDQIFLENEDKKHTLILVENGFEKALTKRRRDAIFSILEDKVLMANYELKIDDKQKPSSFELLY
jgi:hypothetical protein